MAEQWPFKPLVESSSLSTLTFYFDDPWLRAPSRGDIQASPRSLFVLMTLGCEPHRGVVSEPLHAHFFFSRPWLRATSRGGIRASTSTLLVIHLPCHQINTHQDERTSQQCRQCQHFVKQHPANDYSPHRFQQGNYAHHLGFQLL